MHDQKLAAEVKRIRPRSDAFSTIAVVAAFLVIAIATSALRRSEIAYGCDRFGYLRQARLFQEKGPIGSGIGR